MAEAGEEPLIIRTVTPSQGDEVVITEENEDPEPQNSSVNSESQSLASSDTGHSTEGGEIFSRPPPPPRNIEHEKKMQKKAKNRRYSVEEFISTEKTYVSNVQCILTYFHGPLQSKSICTPEELLILFPPILSNIFNMNNRFLQELDTWYYKQNGYDENFMGFTEIIHEYCPFFKMYEQYASTHEKIASTLNRLKNSSRSFVNFCLKVETENNLNTSLDALLVVPIQRPSRYELLLREICKNTINLEEKKALEIAKDEVEKINVAINIGILEHQRGKRVREVEELFRGVSLVSPSRKLLYSGKMSRIGRTARKKYMFFLFNDRLLYGSEGMAGFYNLKGDIDIDNTFTVRDIAHARVEREEYSFEIQSKNDSFIVYTDTEKQKEQWLKILRSVVSEYIKVGVTKRTTVDFNHIQRAAPIFVKRNKVKKCRGCLKQFGLTLWRHHCQICGNVVCANCLIGHLKNNEGDLVNACKICLETASKGAKKVVSTRQNVVISLPDESKIQQMSQGILLKDKKLQGNIIKKSTTINDALKKAARFLHENADIDDYCLCLDNWKEYLEEDKKFADYFVFRQGNTHGLDLSLKKREDVMDYTEAECVQTKPAWATTFNLFSFEEKEEKHYTCPSWWQQLAPEKQESITSMIEGRQYSKRLMNILSDEAGINDDDAKSFLNWWFSDSSKKENEEKKMTGREPLEVLGELGSLEEDIKGIYRYKGAFYKRPYFELRKDNCRYSVYYWEKQKMWCLCTQRNIHSDNCVAKSMNTAPHPASIPAGEWIVQTENGYKENVTMKFNVIRDENAGEN